MGFTVAALLSLCIIIPAGIGLVRFSKIGPVYHPFIYCIWIGFFNELLSVIIVKTGYSNALNGNIYMLAESLLFTWQFKNWKLFGKNKVSFPFIVIIICIAWLFESVIISGITVFNSYFLITYSFILSLMSIHLLSRLILAERGNLLKNPVFLICIAFIIYYTFSVLAEAFWIYGFQSKSFTSKVRSISLLTNLIAILLYSIAIIWMPPKQRFTLPSS